MRTYINGTLYSILTRTSLKEQAKVIWVYVREVITVGIRNARNAQIFTGEFRWTIGWVQFSKLSVLGRQIQYILEQLENEQVEDVESDENEDLLGYDDDEDYETEEEEVTNSQINHF